jgi:hypothetical protein
MAENSQLEKYQTDYLILLVGSNPLPNYVAAQILCPLGKLYLLHSNSTEEIAQNLFHIFGLNRCPPDRLRNLGDAESSPQKIYQLVEEVLADISDNKTIGLHYTGGTKVMSVHAYRAVLNCQHPIICSYLDAHTLEMVITGDKGSGDKRFFVGDGIQISVEDLLRLHGINLKQTPKERSRLAMETAELERLYEALVSIHQTCYKDWREWCNVRFRRVDEAREWVVQDAQEQPPGYKPHYWQMIVEYAEKFKSEGKLKQAELPDVPNLLVVRQIFADQFPNAPHLSLGELGRLCGFPKREDMTSFAKWFDGEWLEDYTLWALQQLIEDGYKLYKPGTDYKAIDPEFQFDVAVTRGYQLFAFACTTSTDKLLCKSKLFEAYVRAQQMGGDEAKTVLICCYEDTDKLEEEMIREFKAEAKIKVFGLNDLPNLKERLKFWFDQVEAGQRRH